MGPFLDFDELAVVLDIESIALRTCLLARLIQHLLNIELVLECYWLFFAIDDSFI
jgi:hypothetical protein